MKRIILCAMVVTSSVVLADHQQVPNPDRTRVAGSALILKADKVIDESSIPSNTISKLEVITPKNKIIDGTNNIVDTIIKKD